MPVMRKATSEPTLPIREDYAEKYTKLLAMKKAREEKARQAAEEKNKQPSDRDDFFQGLIRKEEEEKRKQEPRTEPETPEGLLPTQTSAESGDLNGTQLDQGQTQGRKKSSSFSLEDEEKFLRNLGWVPEEEEKIPELTQDEIVQVKNHLNTTGSFERAVPKDKHKVSLDLSVKKWQHEKFRTMQTVL